MGRRAGVYLSGVGDVTGEGRCVMGPAANAVSRCLTPGVLAHAGGAGSPKGAAGRPGTRVNIPREVHVVRSLSKAGP